MCRRTLPALVSSSRSDKVTHQDGGKRSAAAPSRSLHPWQELTGTADDDIRLPSVVLGLGNANGGIEIVVGKCGSEDGVTVVLQVSRLAAARC